MICYARISQSGVRRRCFREQLGRQVGQAFASKSSKEHRRNRQQRPVSDVAREALRRYIAMEELRSVRERLRPYAEARGFLTDEDVFNAVS